MKTKKSTPSTNKGKLPGILFVSLCIAGAVCALWLFFRSLNQSLYKLDEQPVAAVTYKYKTVQRRFTDRTLWELLKEESPVYNGDVIRTDTQAEAVLRFSDGNTMDLHENTMVRISLRDSAVQADLTDGSITMNTSAGQAYIVLNAGDTRVRVDMGSSVYVATLPPVVSASPGGADGAQKPNAALQVLQGTASVITPSQNQVLLPGSSMLVGTDTMPSVTVLSPEPQAKFLNRHDGPLSVPFTWTPADTETRPFVILETSELRDFSVTAKRAAAPLNGAIRMELPTGTTYWRLYPADREDAPWNGTENGGVSGKLQIIPSPPPELIIPVEGYSLNYRTRKPAVRFIWSDSEWASSWQLCVSDNPGMAAPAVNERTTASSYVASALGEGTWYWQVTPYYAVQNASIGSPSGIHSFTIKRKGELRQPVPVIPAENGIVNTRSGSVTFSWKPEAEAASYTLTVADNPALQSPLLRTTVTENYHTAESGKLKDGTWYWTVTQTDTEGNTSLSPEARSFIALKEDIVLRTTFPPDRYQAADSRIQDIRFAWKTNLPFASRFQVSADSSFSACIIDQPVNASVVQGVNLPEGTWYWRIQADTDTALIETPAKLLYVVPPLEAPLNADDNFRAVVRPGKPLVFRWKPSAGADYYQFKLYLDDQSGEKTGKPVFERNYIEDTQLVLNTDGLEEGTYRWNVQAFSEETENATRRTGLLGEYTVSMKKLTPVSLLTPGNRARINGINALVSPGSVEWSSGEEPAESTFYLSRNPNPLVTPVMYRKNPPYTLDLEPLRAGTYYWTVKAVTQDQFDISAQQVFSFTVLPIPPLKAPEQLAPSDKTIFDAAYLRGSRSIPFTWAPVKDADSYLFVIRNAAGTIIVKETLRSPEYDFKDLAALDRGKFTWSVRGQSFMKDGRLLQDGTETVAEFTIDLPRAGKPAAGDAGTLYGN